ncbi:hypothetical protein CARUB_v10028592mg [Capsella rubella]|uniref:Vitellogenin-like protein n=1 Tax=Capsella rubella TaxID=81985 RepID=R0GVK6_9BRAS|nr:uncharacterized protein DDB_G0271670 [Capsella rubella]EOA15203.1 hypothetical protein CARUB_v10028592mg [Capsella rubella]
MVEVKDQDMGDGMQCINHPFTKNPGGICAFCLQEKLGKLVTSSFPLPKHLASSSTSSSPSFRSDSVGSTTTSSSAANLSASLSLSVSGARNVSNNSSNKLPFLLAKKKKKMLTASSSSSTTGNIVYKRSQSTRTTKTTYGDSDLSPRKRNGFWSFLHLYSSKHHSSSKKVGNFNQPTSQNEAKTEFTETTTTMGSSSSSSASSSMSKRAVNGVSGNRNGIDVIVEEDGSPNIEVTPSERKVSRSRSVGCGSRSFSGDFFERITNGFGDCTLRRVESQREGNNNKGKVSNSNSSSNPSNGVREMVRCGGIFGGFMIMTSSSSSSSSSSWVSSSSAEHQHHHHHHNMGHGGGRNRSWGWAFASPMRAFTSSSSSGKRGRTISDSTSKNTTPNLGAIPSLLAVRN